MKFRFWLIGAGLLAALYFAILGGEYSIFDVNRIQEQRREEVADVKAVRADIDSMRKRVDRLKNDPRAIERIARERYGMIRDGERIYRFVPKDSTETGDQPEDSTGKPQ